jgi:RHS repeat-associated protein
LISRRKSGASNYYLFDALGSTDRLMDASENVQQRYFYTAFGIGELNPPGNPYQWIGQLGYQYDHDFLAGYYVRNRHFSWGIFGRWPNRDPRGFGAGDWNVYRYVWNQPTRRSDPSGLTFIDVGNPIVPIVNPITGQPLPPGPPSSIVLPPTRPIAPPIASIGGHPVAKLSAEAVRAACKCRNYWFVSPSELQFCRCMEWIFDQQQRGLAWLLQLPDCPCSIGSPPTNPNPDIWHDPIPGSPTFHPGAIWEMRSRPTPGYHAQQCAYDAAGKLIKDPPAAGTPDYYSSDSRPFPIGHFGHDVNPYNNCTASGMGKFYFAYRPPNDGGGKC